MTHRQRGFTMAELVAVMIIAAILAVVATSALDVRSFRTTTFTDQVIAQLAYARKAAVAARRPVVVTVTSTAVSLNMCTTLACGATTPLNSPQGSAYVSSVPTGVSIAAVPNFTFDAEGRTGAAVAINVSGSVARTITVEAGSGYAH